MFVILMKSQEKDLDASQVLPKSEALRLAQTLKHSDETPNRTTSTYLKTGHIIPKSEASRLA